MIGLVDSSPTEINAALATLRYTSATASTDTIKMWVSNGTEYIPIANGSNVEFHYYNYTSTATTWTGAYGSSGNGTLGAAGASRTIDGVTLPTGTSFLATARYRAEDLYMKSLGTYAGWLAASDSSSTPVNATEGSWRWMGPDVGGNAGTAFWSGNYSTGSSVGGEYQNWVANNGSLGEPNGSTGENCLGYNGGGVSWNTAPTAGYGWNDFDCSSSRGYFWEAYSTNAPYGSNTTNSAGTNYTSNVLTQTVSVTAPAAAPTGLTATSTTAGQIDLSWTAPGGVADISSYSVQYSSDGTTWTEARGAASTTTTHTLTGLTSGTYYQIRVAAIVPSGTGYFASTYFTPAGASRITALTSTAKTINTLQVDGAVLGSRYVRVVLRATQAGATLKLGGTTSNIGTQRGTANASSITAAGQMIGLTGTVANVNAALQGLVYTGPSTSTTDTISMWVSVGSTLSTPQDFVPVVNSRGEVEFHYFGFTTASLSWQAAVNAAMSDTTKINGVNAPGKFLATVETLDQQVAAMQYYGGAGWLNGGDYTTVSSGTADGAWYWLGPDTGVSQFYSGTQNSGTSGIVGGSFVAWGANASNVQGEPNSGVQQNCLATIASPNALTNSGYTAVANVGGYGWDDGTCTSTQNYFWEYISNEPVGTTSAGDNYTTMTAQAVLVSPSAEGPGTVTATPSGSGAIAVGWTAPTVNAATGITGYTLQYSTSSTFASYSSVNTTAPSAVVTGLTNGTAYYFRVYATGSGWTGAASATATATASATAKTLTVVASGGGDAGTAYANVGGVVVPISTSASINESDLETLLASGDVQLAADTVTISSDVTWSSNADLTLGNSTTSRVAVNADIAASGASAALTLPSPCAYNAAGSYTSCYSLDVRNGANITLTGATPALTIGGLAYDVVNTAAGLAAYNVSGNIAKRWALGNDIDLVANSYTTGVMSAGWFSGTLDGLGNTVSNVRMSVTDWERGFFQIINGATIRNVGVANITQTVTPSGSSSYVATGGLVGYAVGTNTIDQVWTTGAITSTGNSTTNIAVGGVVGWVPSGTTTLTRSWSSVSVDASTLIPNNQMVGGLVGGTAGSFGQATTNNGSALTIREAYSTGSVKSRATGWRGTGGILGMKYDNATTVIANVFSWGLVSSEANSGGLIGQAQGGTTTVTSSYTSAATCVQNTTYSGCTANQKPGSAVSGLTSSPWTGSGATTLSTVASPVIPVFVQPVLRTGNALFADGSFGAVGYRIVDGNGTDVTAQFGTTGYPSVGGTPTWDTISASTAVGTYSVKYVSGLTLSGTAASSYSLSPSPSATSIQLSSATVASAPLNVTVTGSGQTTAVVGWDAPGTLGAGGVTDYRVWVSTSATMTSPTSTTVGSNQTWTLLTGLAANTPYYVQVQAIGSSWVSTLSTVGTGATKSAATSLTVVASGFGVAGTAYSTVGGAFAPAGANTSANVSEAVLEAALATGNVILAADTVTISSEVNWGSNSKLTLGNSTGSTVAINADLAATGTSAGLVIAASEANYSIQTRTGANVVLSGANSTLSIGGGAYTLLRSQAEINAVSSTNAHWWYAIANPITLSSSYTAAPWNFTFTGRLDGLGNTVSNLTINNSTSHNSTTGAGFINNLGGATVRNIGFTNINISSSTSGISQRLGAIAGNGSSAGTNTIYQVWATGFITQSASSGWVEAGGLFGGATAGTLNISRAWSSVAVSTKANYVGSGGIIGTNVSTFGGGSGAGNTLTIDESYSTGNILRDMTTANWYGNGGIIGVAYGYSTTIRNAFSWGNINSTGAQAGTSTAGISGVGGGTIVMQNVYTQNASIGWASSTSGIQATNVSPGSSVTGLTTGLWTTANGSSLVNLPAPTKQLYVRVVAPTDGSYGTLSYEIVDSTGTVQNSSALTTLGLTITGTPTYTIDSTALKGTTYNVNYVSGLTLGGTNAAVYSLSAWIATTSVTITKYNQTVTWAPAASIAFAGGTATPSTLATSSISTTISYAVNSAGATGCSVNASTGVLTYTAAGTCSITATAAASGDYLAASTTVSFVIGSPTSSIIVVSSGGGTQGTDFTISGGRLYVGPGGAATVNASDIMAALSSGSLVLAAQTVTINTALSWSAETTLTLGISTGSTVAINDVISATGTSAGIVIAASSYALNVKAGAALRLPGSSSTLSIGGNAFSLIRSANDFASVTASGRWALANPVSFSGSRTSAPVNLTFTGTFDGLGNTVNGLAFAGAPSARNLALIDTVDGATIRNLGVTNFSASISAISTTAEYIVAAVAGTVKTGTATMSQLWSTGNAVATGSTSFQGFAVGGLVGLVNQSATLNLTKSWSNLGMSSAGVTVTNLMLGGLVAGNVNAFAQGNNSGGGSVTLSEVYATGAINGPTATWWGIGGLIGLVWAGSTTISITDAFSWSPITSTSITTWGGVIGNVGGSIPTLLRTYTTSSYCYYNTAPVTGCTTGVTAGASSGVTGANWSSVSGSSLTNLPAPIQPLYVKPTFSNVTGSINDLSYVIVDSAGATKTTTDLTGLNLSVSGTATYAPSSLPVSATPYSVTYDSGLTLGGTKASLYSLSAWMTGIPVTISRNVTTLSWSPTLALTRLDTGTTLAAPTSNSTATPTYSIAAAGTTGCAVTSARVLTFTAAGTCQVKVDYAQNTTYTAASQTVSIVISNAAPLAPTALTVTGGRADKQLDVSWAAPNTSSTGGTISTYTVEYSTDGTTWTTVPGIAGTSTTITGLTNGTAYTVRVRAINTESMIGAWVTAGSAVAPYWLPSNTSLPTVSGSAVGGLTLTAADGTWNANGGTITATKHQWQRFDGTSWTNISGATSSSYVVSAANDTGKTLRVVVSKTNGSNSSAYVDANSAATATVTSGLATAPQGVTTARGNTQISVNWAAPASTNGGTISAYKVLFKTSAGSDWTTAAASLSASTTSYTITNLTNGTAYDVQVVAVTAAGDGTIATVNSTTPSTTATNTAVPAITGTAAVGVQLSASTGTWNDGGAALTYSYQWQIASTSTGTYANISGATNSTYTPVTADSGKYLKVVVTATNAAGATTATTDASSQIQTGLASAPTGLTPTAGNGQISLTWTAPSTLNGGTIATYNVYTRVSGSGTWVQVTRAASTTASQTITGLINGTAYDLKVEAVTAAGAGLAATYTAATASTPFTTPLNTVVPSVSGTVATARILTATDGTWTDYGHAITFSYQWQVSDTGTSGWTDLAGATSSTYTVASSTVDKYLRIKVTANNGAASNGVEYSVATAAVQTGLAGAPTLGVLTRGDQQIVVNWTAPSALNGGVITGYTVQTSTNGTSWTTASSSVAANATTYTVTGLTNGTAYSVRVFAVTAAGDGATATSGSTVIPAKAPSNSVVPTVTGTPAVSRALSSTDGTWAANGDSYTLSYQWQSAATANGTYTNISGATSASYTPVTADRGRFLRLQVTATNAMGSTSAVSIATAAVDTGLADAPTALTATFNASPSMRIAVGWTAPAGLNGATAITGYVVEYRIATTGTWTVASSSVAANATSYDLTGLTSGTSYDIRVAAKTAAGTGATVTTSSAVLFGGAPSNTAAPTVSGSLGVGETLTVTDGSWNDYGVTITGISYQWQRSSDGLTGWTDISGETYNSYTLTTADSGKYVRAVVEATNVVGSTGTSVTAGQIGTGIPTAPQSFAATDGNGQITLSWSAPASANGGIIRGYIVELNSGSGWSQVGATLGSGATGKTITGLTNAQSYDVRVRAITTLDGVNATLTGKIPFTTPSNTGLPTLSGPVAVGETLTTTDGTWSANGRALTSISYAWQVSSNSGTSWTNVSGATNPSYDIPSGATGNLYRVVVSRTNEAGTTTATSLSTTATESGVADAPTSVTVTRGDQQLTLNWTAPSQLNGGILRDYRVEYRVAGAPSWTTASRSASTATSQTITGLSNGTSYEFQVTSVTGITGLTSSTVSGIPAGAPIVNSAATIAAGTRAVGYTITGTAGSFGINDAGTLSYSHRWEVSSTGTSGWVAIAGATASTFTPTSAEAGKYLRYVHIATNTRFSTESTTSATTVIGSGIPAAPATVTATVGAASGQINVSWAAVTGADLNGAVRGVYRIQVSTDGTTWSTPELSATANDTSYNVTGLTNGTPYMVRVAAASSLDVVGSPTQATGTFIPYATPINTTVPSVSGAEARGYVLTSSAGIWNPNGRSVSQISYQWQVSADSGSSWTDISGATSSTYTLTANESGKLVRSRVTATNLAGSTSIETAPTGVIGTASAAAPTNLNVSPGDQQLSVSWTAPTQLDGGTIVDYEVSISTDQNTWTTVTRTPSTTTAQAITGLTNATNYWVRVAAVTTVTGAPVTSASATIPFGLPINTAVPTVSGSVRIGDTLTAAAGTWNGNGRTITETAYQWQTSTDGGLSWTDVSGATNASYVPSGVLGKLLRVRVTNTNLAGATSEVSAATVAVGIGTPGAPTGITLTPGDLAVTVNWTAPTWLADGSIQDYTVELNDGNGWIAVSRTASTVTSQTITGLALGTSYQVRVRTETGLSSAWLTSGNYVAIGKPAITTAPVVSGTTLAGETLTTTTGTWDINGSPLTSTTIRWQQSLDNGSNWTDIGGATSTTYIAAAGRIYRASITATNAAGSTTTNTAPTAYVVSVRPSAVRNLSIVPGDHSLAVTWTIPESLGGGTISDYLVEYSLNGDDWTAVSRTPSATPSQVITGLTNGSDYYVRVQAATTVTGFYALSSGQFRPYGAPISFGSLALISGTVRYAQTLTASTGSWDFNGSLSSAYAYQWQVSTDSGANWSNIAGATSSSLTLSGYVGNLIRVQVTATNIAGQATTATSNPTIAVDAANPTVPRDFSITPGDHQIALSWTVPSSLGGSALVGYTVQISETGNTWTTISRASALATTETITGLTNAVQYYVRVRAETLKSGGWANSPSTVVPYGRPINTVTPTLSGTAQYDSVLTADSGSWNENGSSASVSYQWQADTGSGWVNIPGATNAQYTVGNYVGAVVRSVVTATNAAGSTSAAASASTTIIAAPAGAVTGLTVTPADQSLQLAWTAPNYLGGAPIVDYRIEYSTDGSSWQSSPRSASATPSHTITGLVNGTAYQVRVRALNGVTGIAAIDASGTIPRGLPQNTVAPVVTMHPNSPTAPQIGRAISADTGTWLANGADISAVTYQWQVGSGSSWTSIAGATLASYTPTGNVGSQLRVTVTATNAAGDTTATSLTTTAILPAAASAPRNVTVIEDDHAFTLNWQAPSSTGGAPVTDYEVQLSLDGDTWTPVTRSASTETTQIVSGLDNAVSYYARIRALNGVTGSWSFVTDIVPRGVPANLVAPSTAGTYEFRSVLTANDGDWDENGALITTTGYQWQASRDGIDWVDIPSATQQNLTVGLYVGSMLRVKVTKTNEAGSTTELSAATPVITAIPAATPVITSQQIGNTQVTLGWTPPIHSGGVTLVGYTLQYSTDQVNWTTINLGATTTSTTLTGLANGTGHFARVRAETDRPGEWSPVAGPFTPVAPPVVVRLTAPISPTPSPLTSVLLTSVMPIAPVVTSMSSLTGPAEVTVTSDGRIELQPTQSVALKNGQPVQASVTLTETGMVVQTDTVNLALAFDAVSDATTAANLQQGANAAVTGEGFAPNTPVVTWIQSTPTKLGTTTSSVTGSVNGSFTIPHTIAPGPHTIQINSVDVEGNVVSIIYGVEVKAAETTMQAMGTNLGDPHALSEAWLWWAIFGALVMLMLLAIIALRRRARS